MMGLEKGVWCPDCGEMKTSEYLSRGCHEHPITIQRDRSIPSYARLSLPNSLMLKTIDTKPKVIGVFPKTVLQSRTLFGPVVAAHSRDPPEYRTGLEMRIRVKSWGTAAWLCMSDENLSNWMRFVRPATCSSEVNMVAFQTQRNVYFITTKPVLHGTELRVWYCPDYARYMAVPHDFSDNPPDVAVDVLSHRLDDGELPDEDYGRRNPFAVVETPFIEDKCKHPCPRCDEVFISRTLLNLHQQECPADDRRRLDELLKMGENHQRQNASKEPERNQFAVPEVPDSIAENSLSQVSNNNAIESNQCSTAAGICSVSESPSPSLVSSGHASVQYDVVKKPVSAPKPAHVVKSTASAVQPTADAAPESPFIDIVSIDDIDVPVVSSDDEMDLNVTTLDDTEPEESSLRDITMTESDAKSKSEETEIGVKKKQKMMYSCSVCSKILVGVKSWNLHVKSHLGDRSHVCSHCNKGFSSSSKLKRHSLSHEDKTKSFNYQCEQCGSKFQRADHYKKHVSTHNRDRSTLRCDECGKKYHTNFAYKVHLGKHEIDRGNFKCVVCFMIFKDKSGITTHYKRHNGSSSLKGEDGKTMECDHCQKTFFNSRDLRRHKTVHTQVKSFLCQYCPHAFSRMDHLDRHQKAKHGKDSVSVKAGESSRNVRQSKSDEAATVGSQKTVLVMPDGNATSEGSLNCISGNTGSSVNSHYTPAYSNTVDSCDSVSTVCSRPVAVPKTLVNSPRLLVSGTCNTSIASSKTRTSSASVSATCSVSVGSSVTRVSCTTSSPTYTSLIALDTCSVPPSSLPVAPIQTSNKAYHSSTPIFAVARTDTPKRHLHSNPSTSAELTRQFSSPSYSTSNPTPQFSSKHALSHYDESLSEALPPMAYSRVCPDEMNYFNHPPPPLGTIPYIPLNSVPTVDPLLERISHIPSELCRGVSITGSVISCIPSFSKTYSSPLMASSMVSATSSCYRQPSASVATRAASGMTTSSSKSRPENSRF